MGNWCMFVCGGVRILGIEVFSLVRGKSFFYGVKVGVVFV